MELINAENASSGCIWVNIFTGDKFIKIDGKWIKITKDKND